MQEIRKLVAELKKFKPGKPLKKYICYAVFPKFKNIEPGARIDFDFPLTALVGPNGSGKSSLLHALWGMPYGYSTSKFWFSTDLDPIESNQEEPQRYFYGHWHEGLNNVVETRKARLGKKTDYWEPYRLSTQDGMKKMIQGEFEGKSKDRWNPVKRKVIYINFRALFGSFDRYFYFDDGINMERRKAMLSAAKRLKRLKDEKLKSFKLYNVERLFENRVLKTQEIDIVSKILGRPYEAAHLIRHSLYPKSRGKDLSVVFKRNSEYSEAFAGSGEIAAVSAVVEVLAAEEYSLILLDEPETSLHPGAQRELLKFLLEQIKIKKHQIVLSTHSQEFLNELPQNAIKVFEDNGHGKSRILQNSSPSTALNRLGLVPKNKKCIIVEDNLAKHIILHAAGGLDKGDFERLEVRVAQGGAGSILKHMGPAFMVSGVDVFIFLDGDQKKVEALRDPEQISPAEYSDLEDLMKNQIGVIPSYHIPGGSSGSQDEAKKSAALEYLAWLRKRLAYLPKNNPEEIIINAFNSDVTLHESQNNNYKNILKSMLMDGTDIEMNAQGIEVLARVKIAKIPSENSDMSVIRDQLRRWLND